METSSLKSKLVFLSLLILLFFVFLRPSKILSQTPDPITISSRVNSSSDDAEEAIDSGSVGLSSTDLELGAEGGTVLQLVGMRFNNLQIPQGATIANAHIEFEVDESQSAPTFVTIRGESSDNPVTFINQTTNISSRLVTTASVSWDNIPPWTVISEKKITPDLGSIIQEIVNRPGWTSGNSLVITIKGTGIRTAESYNGEAPNAPLLVISYFPSGAPTLTPTSTPTPTPSPTPFPEGTIRLAVIGDFGTDNTNEARVANLVNSWNPDHVITTGDNNYPDGEATTIDPNIGKYYSQYIGNYQGFFGLGSAVNRFWPSLGNHDWHTITCGINGCSGAYFDYFTLPNNERYYDVDLGLVRLYSIDSESAEPDGRSATSVQANWLQNQLASSNSCYDLVFFHHPPYSSGLHGSTTSMRWPFATWGTEAIFNGHDHLYERLDAGGTPYFVNGAGGASLYTFDNLGTLPAGVTSVVRYNEDHGAMLVTATSTNITYEFYNAQGALIDSYTVAKDCAGGPTPTPTSTPTQTPTPPSGSTTITVQVATSSDDAEENVSRGSISLTSSDLEFTTDGTKTQTVGMRFAGVTVPSGTAITDAYIQFVANETQPDVTNLTFYGQAVDNVPSFTTTKFNVSSRTKTLSSVVWNAIPVWTVGVNYQTPNLSPVIGEIINRPGWVSGNALAIVVTGTGHRTAYSYDGGSTKAAKLVITYQ